MTFAPTNMSQNVAFPSPSRSILPVIFGYQKKNPAKAAITSAMTTLWKWATTKYVSCVAKSTGGEASRIPRHAAEQEGYEEADRRTASGVSNLTEPRHIVPIQLKNLIPVGTAIR